MNARIALAIAGLLIMPVAQPHDVPTTSTRRTTAGDSLRGAWRLVSLEEPGASGVLRRIDDARGSLIYTTDGHMSVQVMFATLPASPSGGPVQYAEGGYEGSFGRYDVDESTHIVTHHVEGANVRTLAGKDLPRSYRFENGRLIIRSTRADERWSVTWERP